LDGFSGGLVFRRGGTTGLEGLASIGQEPPVHGGVTDGRMAVELLQDEGQRLPVRGLAGGKGLELLRIFEQEEARALAGAPGQSLQEGFNSFLNTICHPDSLSWMGRRQSPYSRAKRIAPGLGVHRVGG